MNHTTSKTSLNKARLEIVGIYILIGIGGFTTMYLCKSYTSSIQYLISNLIMTAIAFMFSLYKKNSSVYDAYWSVIPFYFILAWFIDLHLSFTLNQLIAASIVSLWSWRLTYNWYRSWSGWSHEDWRYVDFRNKLGSNFIWMNLFGLHLYPTLIVYASMLGLFWVFSNATIVSHMLFALGSIISLVGIYFEYSADNTLYQSKKNNSILSGEVLRSGLWKYSRNPNYLGEMLFWIGIAIIGLSYAAPWWTILGSVGMVCMFLFASIPMKENRLRLSRKESFEKYKAEVSKIIPMPPKI